MLAIQVRTIGEVALATQIKLAEGYHYDVPVDGLGIPYLPLRKILDAESWMSDDAMVGFAHPEGYLGMSRDAHALKHLYPSAPSLVRSLFTNERYFEQKGYRVRSLKRGLVFHAIVRFEDDQVAEVARRLKDITRLGVSEGDVTGEVSCRLVTLQTGGETLEPSALCTYTSLVYSCEFLTPACFHTPYADGVQTQFHVPGAAMRKALLADMGWIGDPAHDGLAFDNAYIAHDKQRLLPLPLCMSQVKLDKEQLRYRLSAGKDPKLVEQDVALSHAFGRHFGRHMVRYVSPEAERVVSRDGDLYDALCAGQSFMGTIYGSDRELRAIAAQLNESPIMRMGHLTSEGLGEAYVKVERMCESDPVPEMLARTFDVACVSHAHLIDDEGMPSYDARQLLDEIERLLGVPGRLKIRGRYTDVYKDFGDDGSRRGITRCLAMGSVMRVTTRDEQPVDIAPILHTFVGERQDEGYGEIVTYPAHDLYYRVTERLAPQKYAADQRETLRDMHFGSAVVHHVLEEVLRQRVRGLSALDRQEHRAGVPVEDQAPTEVLDVLREHYAPLTTREQLFAWYEESLREDEAYAWRID